MAAGELNLTVEQGTTFSQTLTWKIDGTAVNLTGYTARMQARDDVTSSATILSLTQSAGLTLGGVAGTIIIALTATQTAALVAGNYVYDLELASSGGVVTRLVQGTLAVSAEVTR
jgi:hypothetical protein